MGFLAPFLHLASQSVRVAAEQYVLASESLLFKASLDMAEAFSVRVGYQSHLILEMI